MREGRRDRGGEDRKEEGRGGEDRREEETGEERIGRKKAGVRCRIVELSRICYRCGKMIQKTSAEELKNYTVRLVQVKCMKDNEDDLMEYFVMKVNI